ncbi:hypothetical protein BaRGS_00002559, partial [Batillaria attramentaria]
MSPSRNGRNGFKVVWEWVQGRVRLSRYHRRSISSLYRMSWSPNTYNRQLGSLGIGITSGAGRDELGLLLQGVRAGVGTVGFSLFSGQPGQKFKPFEVMKQRFVPVTGVFVSPNPVWDLRRPLLVLWAPRNVAETVEDRGHIEGNGEETSDATKFSGVDADVEEILKNIRRRVLAFNSSCCRKTPRPRLSPCGWRNPPVCPRLELRAVPGGPQILSKVGVIPGDRADLNKYKLANRFKYKLANRFKYKLANRFKYKLAHRFKYKLANRFKYKLANRFKYKLANRFKYKLANRFKYKLANRFKPLR